MTDCPTKSDCDSNTSTTDTERREIVGLFPKLDLTEVFTEYGHLSSGAIIDLILEKQHQIPCKRGTCLRLMLKACSFAIGVSAWWPRWLGGRVFRIMLSSIKAKVTGVPVSALLESEGSGSHSRKQSVKECMECTVCWESATVEELCFCDGTTTVTSSTSSSSNDGQQNTIVTLSNETHAFCRQCLERHALATVEEMPLAKGGLGLRCMVNDCENPITFQEIQTFMSPSMVQRLEERCAELSVVQANLSYMERCRSCNCAVELGASPAVLQVFRCPECRLQFCRLCDEQWQDEHKGISCEQFGKQQNRERLLEKRLSEAVVRNCLKCKVAFVKHDGCNRVTCRCGANQCYICRENDIDYDHFCRCFREKIPPKLPFKCSKCGKGCLLWQKAEPVEKQQMERIRREMEEEEKAKAKKRLSTGTAAGTASTSATSSSSRIPLKNKGKVVATEKPHKNNGKHTRSTNFIMANNGASNKNNSQKKRYWLPPELQYEVFSALPFYHGRRLLLLRSYCVSLVRRQKRLYELTKRDPPTELDPYITALETRWVHSEVHTWTLREVARWVNFVTRGYNDSGFLASSSLGDRCVEAGVDGTALLLLTVKQLLTDLKFKVGPAAKLLSALDVLKQRIGTSSAASTSSSTAADTSASTSSSTAAGTSASTSSSTAAGTSASTSSSTAAGTSASTSSSTAAGTSASTSTSSSVAAAEKPRKTNGKIVKK